jgi:hypothetical protein
MRSVTVVQSSPGDLNTVSIRSMTTCSATTEL